MYELFYWPEIQGRGEFVRLVLEDVQAPYIDVARNAKDGDAKLMKALHVELAPYAFAVPVLRAKDAGDVLVISQTAAITRYLGERHGLAPADEPGRLAALSVALTIADAVVEVHDTHHPISVMDYYENQKDAAIQRAKAFRESRLEKFLLYFERMLGHDRTSDGRYLIGDAASYADLGAFQLVEGLHYAFPRAMKRVHPKIPKLLALRDRIAERPNIATYLSSPRRIPFNESGIFRHYAELDA